MEFFAEADTRCDVEPLQQALTIAALPRFCSEISRVLRGGEAEGEIYCHWGSFVVHREEIGDGVRFTLPKCPNALAWTVTCEGTEGDEESWSTAPSTGVIMTPTSSSPSKVSWQPGSAGWSKISTDPSRKVYLSPRCKACMLVRIGIRWKMLGSTSITGSSPNQVGNSCWLMASG